MQEVYSIRVKTTDQNGLSIEKSLTINITDVNENPLPDLIPYKSSGHWFSLIVVLKTLPDKGLTENTKLKKLFPS
jgi:hypothetical protein